MFKKVACRDYPHARHLCAKFPFSSTPHEKHCGQCHCYVCDSLAPCLKWGTGILNTDHCHANDKTDMWKVQRKDFRRTQSSPLPASTNYGTSHGVVRSQRFENLPRDINHLSPNSVLRKQPSRSTVMHTPSSLNSISQNQVSRPKSTYAHYSLSSGTQNPIVRSINIPVSRTATNLTIPNGANHGSRYVQPRSTLARDRSRPHSVQLLGVRSHAIQKERERVAISLRPQFLRSPMMSKGVVGRTMGDTLAVNHMSHGSSCFNNHVNAVHQHDKFHTATGFSNPINCNGPGDVCPSINLSTFSDSISGPVSLSCVNQCTVTPETQVYGQTLSQPNDSLNFRQTCIQGNDAPYVACLNSNQHGNDIQIKSQDESANGNITHSGITSQDTFQPKAHEEIPNITSSAEGVSAFDSSWAAKTNQSIELLVEGSALQSSGSIDQSSNVENSSTDQFTGNIEPQNESFHIPSSMVDIENWLLGKDSSQMGTDDVLSFEMNIPSPDPSPFDEGMLLSPWW
ncbi:uncharacterized protein [Cicer arietinum]|uniref:Uncharacterized protein LOC101513143 isoform X2 n=1 Tax=Cicer arietinum TaxID=3827 RepID=A0A1S3E341_CICAR|nr:uncharacterized protein LOC101513143 isoform X2 [Cicer arietinum]XP_027189479.1 uncharacterized protein LOC101513143 isoform X2 [Cicer arietinum]